MQVSELSAAVHAANNLLQGPYYDDFDHATSMMSVINGPGNAVATSTADGYPSIQVLTMVLSQHNLLLEAESETLAAPEAEQGFLCFDGYHFHALRVLHDMWYAAACSKQPPFPHTHPRNPCLCTPSRIQGMHPSLR
jgi:hypothetical protein